MGQTIRKKVWKGEMFDEVFSGNKTFDLRLADWECSPGDTLVLEEFDMEKDKYTGRTITKKVGHILKTNDVRFFAKEDVDRYGFQIISLLDEGESK